MRNLRLSLALVLLSGCAFDFGRGADLNPGDIAGRAVTEEGAPLPHARVRVEGTGRVIVSDREGDFVIPGLPAGTFVLRLSHDFNGDGLAERATTRAVQLRARDGEVGFLVVGLVPLPPIARATGLVRDQDGNPVAGVTVVAVRGTELEPGLVAEGGVEERTTTDDEGAFTFAALAAGDLSFKAFLEVEEGFLASEPAAVTLSAGDDVDVPIATLVIDRGADTERQVQIELTPAPEGEDIKVVLSAPGTLPPVAELLDFESGLVAPGGPSISLPAVPVGTYDVHLSTQGGLGGLLCGQAPAAPGPVLEIWGSAELRADLCSADVAGQRDCDEDGQPGLPVLGGAPVTETWTECAPQCARAFGGAGANPTCETAAGAFDCDDDGDGQPDVTEPFACTTPCAGHDTDGDGLCAAADPLPQCASNDPADPACFTDPGPGFNPPPVRPEYGGPPPPVVDAGPGPDPGLDAGPDAGPGDAGVDAGPLPRAEGAVQPRFPINGAVWGQFVRAGLDGSLSDEPCDTNTAIHFAECVHGAARLALATPELTTCDGVTARDALDALRWVCVEDVDGIALQSRGFKAGRGLQDLIDYAAIDWAEDRVIVTQDGVDAFESAPERWWSSPVALANGGLVFGDDAPNTVYVVDDPDPQSTWSLDDSGASLVVAPGTVLVDFQGAPGGALGLVTINGEFNFFEGDMEVANNALAVSLSAASFPTVRNVSIVNAATEQGIGLQVVSGARVIDVLLDGVNGGIALSSSEGALVQRLTSFSPLDDSFVDGQNHLVRDLRVFNDVASNLIGFRVGASNSVVQGVHVANCDNTGVGVDGFNNVLLNITAGHCRQTAFAFFNGGDFNHLHHATLYGTNTGASVTGFGQHVYAGLFVGNGTGLVSVQGNNDYEDVASLGNDTTAVQIAGNALSNFTGRLWVDAACEVTSGLPNPGLIDVTCTDDGAPLSSTYTGQSSDAVLHPSVDALGVVLGRVATEDLANASDTGGAALFDDIADFADFDTEQRAWGAPGAGEVNRGRCAAGQTCNIYDLSLRSVDDADPNGGGLGVPGAVARGVVPLPSTSERVRWSGFGANAAECAPTHYGSQSDGKECFTDHIADAFEILDDERGNDDGLCETDEACVFLPNLGAYPGHGPLELVQDPFAAGNVTGVRLLRFATNGR